MLSFYITLQGLLSDRRDALAARDDRGATAVEYGLMVALIAAVIIGAVTALGTNLIEKFEEVAEAVGIAGD
ncbi:MAG: Flp family type IVb pilin [Mycobacteriales bacterium]|nr:Flp family type IVb pilin [Mycobacteriales bacterium]